VNYFSETISPTRARALSALATLGAVLLVAGCGGSSGGSSTLTIGNESKADSTLITGTASTSSTSSTGTSTTSTTTSSGAATTPTSGPLSEEPKIPHGFGSPPTHVVKQDVIIGKGAEAKQGSTVEVNYIGGLWRSGKEFDASWRRKEPFKFTLGAGEVIKGWEEAVVGMKVGGRRLIVIPPASGYGAKSTASIPGNSTLTFIIDLLKVN
jgi:peptidylprolyl isomerase